ncbi:hypothetical protein K1719_019400 [Acacia pycnantha]|nr:hypothetical protein K1719_019400 [Acacia pycnantha]
MPNRLPLCPLSFRAHCPEPAVVQQNLIFRIRPPQIVLQSYPSSSLGPRWPTVEVGLSILSCPLFLKACSFASSENEHI